MAVRKPFRPAVGSRICECTGCRQYFASPTAFDKHRHKGQCRTQAALRRAGWKRNSRGVWALPEKRSKDAEPAQQASQNLD